MTELAWHFLGEVDGKPVLRDGRLLEVGKRYEHEGALVLCGSGFHASTMAIDALRYAPGSWVSLCVVDDLIRGDDKVVARHRTAQWVFDCSAQLRLFARRCALSVADAWEMPAIVRQFLETGDESLESAAESAAWSAAESAAWSAAESAAWSAAESAAWSAAESAAWSAAESAAWSAAWSAARSAAWSAAWSAAESAAWSAAESAAWSAAESAAWERFNKDLESLLMAGAP